jgi:hypothetical protein
LRNEERKSRFGVITASAVPLSMFIALVMVPMDKRELVETLYEWGARNAETHLLQVRGKFQAFNGVNLPSFLPETG